MRADGPAPSDGDTIEEAVDRHDWVERITRIGWIAKGVVYTLMGLTGTQIARQNPTPRAASPEGSIARVAAAPLGRVLLVVLTVGLLLYFVWRVLSVALISEHSLSAWADRVGYTFSGLFYLVLSFTAGRAALSAIEPEDSNSVESISARLLDVTAGRWLLAVGGLVTIGVGAYFTVRKGLQRSFTDELDGVGASLSENEPKRRIILVAGTIGWIGRGIVTAMVGFFVVRSAYRFDPDDARGFDRALRQVAGTTSGSVLVFLCAVALLAYGIFCLISVRFRSLDEAAD